MRLTVAKNVIAFVKRKVIEQNTYRTLYPASAYEQASEKINTARYLLNYQKKNWRLGEVWFLGNIDQTSQRHIPSY